MIGKEKFIEFINKYRKNEDLITDLDRIFPGCFESCLFDYTYYLFDSLLEIWFTAEGIDWIYYYLFENPENYYYQYDKKLSLETIDDLWELIKEYRK